MLQAPGLWPTRVRCFWYEHAVCLCSWHDRQYYQFVCSFFSFLSVNTPRSSLSVTACRNPSAPITSFFSLCGSHCEGGACRFCDGGLVQRRTAVTLLVSRYIFIITYTKSRSTSKGADQQSSKNTIVWFGRQNQSISISN